MDSSTSQLFAVTDRELLIDFRDSLADQAETLERQIAQLRLTPSDQNTIAVLFRALHTIKGDASVCMFELGVRITHPIETVLVRLREGTLPFSPLLAEALLLALDRLELSVETILAGRSLEPLRIDALVTGLQSLDVPQNADLEKNAIKLIEAVTGFRPVSAGIQQISHTTTRAYDQAQDLAFFETLALQLDSYSPLFKGRTARLLELAQKTNAQAGKPVDPGQLEAAVYLHDVGMMFLPEAVWFKVGALSDDERKRLRAHPGYSAGLAERMVGWREAATIVAQHHEMSDGGGYPHGLKDHQIVPGAKILAIVDAFEAVTQKHSHRGEGRSLLRAIAEINASDKQFSAEWIMHFNSVIRGMLETEKP